MMKMNKLLYKDELYYYRRCLSSQYNYVGSSVRIYIEREGFWSIFSKYKQIAVYTNGEKDVAKDNKTLTILIDGWKKQQKGAKPLIIDCSPEVEELYE